MTASKLIYDYLPGKVVIGGTRNESQLLVSVNTWDSRQPRGAIT